MTMGDFLRRHGCDATDIRDLGIIAAFIATVFVWCVVLGAA
ncbi:hypothetical protein ACVISU_008146 [Bradyrhizobium sp. USDA 4452]